MSFAKQIIQLILSPGHGWEDISREETPIGELTSKGFYPLTAMASLSVFCAKIYHPTRQLSELLIEAIVTFVMFFVSFFLGSMLLSMGLEQRVYSPARQGSPDTWRFQAFTIFNLSLLEIIVILQNCLPPIAILLWLPLAVGLVVFKGRAFLEIDEPRTRAFMIISLGAVLLLPYALEWLLTKMLTAV